ncbi:MAG TPA: thioredoxin domain-containing protein [Acidimicrobiales bacterium]
MNRLAEETSPYLQQHKDNPVDWYPWGDEAFARARAEDKPILLSVGYAACHWCHVMAHESFEDPATAEVMNRNFVNVKVDREERPDVDSVYMEAVQAMSGHGGWPMTVWLTPDGHPFYGGTYYPNTPRMGMPAFTQLCEGIAEAWRERRDEVVSKAGKLTELLNESGRFEAAGDDLPGIDAVDRAAAQLAERFDPQWGGFGRAPKFPQPDLLELLLRVHARTQESAPLALVTTTLDAMASGGIYDHVGGGFHRYSVDREWLVPHFEKMLYDQALLARVYLHAWQVTGEQRHLQVASETIDYVRRDLRHPEGGFYSSEDADSEGVEGKFYVWSRAEVQELGGDAAVDWYGVTPAGNFEGANILIRPVRGDLVRPPEVEAARQALFERRETRVRPGLDDKVLTEWNGLFLATLAEAAAATGRSDWLDDARTGADFLLASLRRQDGRWLRSWQGGRANHLAYAADYAALASAFTKLAEATGEARWVAEARGVADGLLHLFWDDGAGLRGPNAATGGLFTAGGDAEQLITRAKDVLDNVIPSANGSAAVALVRLAALTGEERYRDRAADIVRLVAEPLSRHPTAFAHLLAAVELLHGPVTEVAVTGDRRDLVEVVQRRYLPTAVLAWGEPYPSPLFENRDQGWAYVCQHYSCKIPTDNVEELEAQLAG